MNQSGGELADLTRGWSVPAELTGSPPRQVKYSAVGILAMVLMLALVAGGAVLSYTLYNEASEKTTSTRMLAEQGVETEGTVTRLWRGGRKNRSFLVGYEFQVRGQVFHGQASVPRSFWEHLSEGKRLKIRHAATDPERNRPDAVPAAESPAWVIALIPLTFLGVTAFVVHRVRKQRRLLEDGRAAPGVITKSTRTKHGRAIRYDFLLPAGTRASGSGMAKRGPSDVGSVITVVYDPDNPGSSAPYPFELVKLIR